MGPDGIIGRTDELTAIERFFDRGSSGVQALLIEGDAGIGKTTLWEEALDLAGREGLVLSSRPSHAEVKLSFSVLSDLLGPIVFGVLEDLPPGQRTALEAALVLGPTDTRPDARAVSLAVLGAVRSIASRSSVTIAIDDLQWTDELSARTLAFVVRRLVHEPVTLVAAKRAEEAGPLDILGPEVQRLTLGPIGVAGLGRLLRLRLDHHFPPPDVAKIHHASGGNPFFAMEIGRAILRDRPNLRPGEPLPVPKELDVLLKDRLSALSEHARRVLLIASSAGTPTSSLVAAAGGDLDGLDEAERAGFVVVRGGVIAFTHPLLAASVYGSATSQSLRDVHARLADNATDAEERARHLALSTDEPEEKAALIVEEAARRAVRRGAPSAAAELFQLAVSLTPSTMGDDWRRRSDGAAGNLWAAGDVVSARDLNERMISELGPGPGRAHSLYLSAEASWNDLPRVTSLLTQGLEEVGDDRGTRAWILIDLAWAAVWACDLVASVPFADEALEIADALEEAHSLDEPALLRAALSARAMVSTLLGDDAEASLQRGISVEGARDYNELATPRTTLGQLQMWRGALDAARITLEDELDHRVAQGHVTSTWEVRALLAEVEFRAGHFLLAAEHAREAWEILTETGWSDVLGQVLPIKAAIACVLGDLEQARADAVEALALSRRMHDRWDEIQARSALGFLEVSLGDHAACHAALDPIVRRTERMGLVDPAVFPYVPDEVEALVALGDLDAADRLTERLEDQGNALDRPLARATAARCRALIQASRGDLAGALHEVERATGEHEGVPQPFDLARTLLTKGELERRLKMRSKARETLEGVERAFEELGAPLWAARARAERARIGGRASATKELTTTERRAAQLAAAGHTNREIAGMLFVSVKTVEANLSRAYHKLGIRSRRELVAARLAGDDTFDP